MTRHDLKDQLQHDTFTDAVSGAVTYASSHRKALIQAAIGIVVVGVLAAGVWWYRSSQAEVRQGELDAAMSILDAQVGPGNGVAKSYPTEDAKKEAWSKAVSAVIAKHGGTPEGLIAQYYRGTDRAGKGDTQGAGSDLRAVADSGSAVSPLAKIGLVNLYLGEKKGVEAQALLQDLIKNPSALVSKAQAQLLQAQVNSTLNPQAAKDVLKSLDAADLQRQAVKRASEQLTSDLSK